MSYVPHGRRRVLRVLYIPAGWALIALGIAIGPLPGPGGIPVVALGVIILLKHSHWARRRFIRLRRRYPQMLGRVEAFLRRKKRQRAQAAPSGPPSPPPAAGA